MALLWGFGGFLLYLYFTYQRGREIFHRLMNSPEGKNTLGSKCFFRSPTWVKEPKFLGQISLLSQLHQQGAGSRSSWHLNQCLYGMLVPQVMLCLLWHNAALALFIITARKGIYHITNEKDSSLHLGLQNDSSDNSQMTTCRMILCVILNIQRGV